MLFNYKALENSGKQVSGSIEAISLDVAISSLQRRGLIVVTVEPAEKESWLSKFSFGSGVPYKDVVVLLITSGLQKHCFKLAKFLGVCDSL